MSAYLSGIGTANPQYKITQDEVLSFMQGAHQLNEEEAHDLAVLYRATGIKNRYSVLEDYTSKKENSFFSNNSDLEPFPTTKERNQLYQKEALKISLEAARNCIKTSGITEDQITHVITVSCTGLNAPGLDIEIIQHLNLKRTTERTGINFMGCYAAFNALKAANYICNSTDSKVLIICTELCSLHFQKKKSEDNFLANALFGDGSAAVIIQSTAPKGKTCLEISDFYCDLLPNGSEEMTWEVGNEGFEMKLSSYVPDVIESGIDKMIERLKSRTTDTSFDFYAIHPGGKKILQVLENALNISKQQNIHAYRVLEKYGNMSSPTILFVLKSILEKLSAQDEGKQILSFAFGPGLTLESMIFKISHH